MQTHARKAVQNQWHDGSLGKLRRKCFGPVAGGHSAPPRGKLTLDEKGEPIYSPKDEADVEKMVALGLPFGHGGANVPLPVGARASWDGEARTLAFEEEFLS